jgi:hypothetical protein
MDVHAVAAALRSYCENFKGSETELLRELFAHSDPRSLRDVPSNPRSFRLALKTIAPELLALGVSVTIFDTGMVHVKSASAAQTEASAEATLRSSFFSALPEAKVLRQEFGNDEHGFQRFAAYRRGLGTGQIHPPRTGRLAVDDQGTAQVDVRLPIEKQCRKRWDLEPSLRSEFRNNFESFLAYERANAAGQVRRLVPRA